MTVTQEEMITLAQSVGFSHVGPLDPATLVFAEEVREMCAADRCGSYGKNWSCPPYCGSLEELSWRAGRYAEGVLLQSTGVMEDDFDFETMMATERLHKDRFNRLVREVKKIGQDCMPMSAGACCLCGACGCPKEPCRFPELAYPSMEACGVMVSDTCEKNGMGYYYGPCTVTYTACILF